MGEVEDRLELGRSGGVGVFKDEVDEGLLGSDELPLAMPDEADGACDGERLHIEEYHIAILKMSNGHFGGERDAHTSFYHTDDCIQLGTFDGYLGSDAALFAVFNGLLTEAVSFLH